MDEDQKEELLEAMEGVANFMRGMAFDTRIPSEAKEALHSQSEVLDKLVAKYL